jgi:hypothetical protein
MDLAGISSRHGEHSCHSHLGALAVAGEIAPARSRGRRLSDPSSTSRSSRIRWNFTLCVSLLHHLEAG